MIEKTFSFLNQYLKYFFNTIHIGCDVLEIAVVTSRPRFLTELNITIIRINMINSQKIIVEYPGWIPGFFGVFSCGEIPYFDLSIRIEKCKKVFFRIVLILRVFFRLFRGFTYKTFLYSEKQSRAYNHKIRRKIPDQNTMPISGHGTRRGKIAKTWPKMSFYVD